MMRNKYLLYLVSAKFLLHLTSSSASSASSVSVSFSPPQIPKDKRFEDDITNTRKHILEVDESMWHSKKFVATEGGPIIAIIADYDSCFEVISPSNWSSLYQMKNKRPNLNHWMTDKSDRRSRRSLRIAIRILTDAIDAITNGASKVILYSGTARQSVERDQQVTDQNGNGSAYQGFAELAEMKGWELGQAPLLGNQDEHESYRSYKNHGKRLKARIANTVLDDFYGKYQDSQSNLQAYFFDDREIFLKSIRESTRHHSVQLHTIHYFVEGVVDELNQINQPKVHTRYHLESFTGEVKRYSSCSSHLRNEKKPDLFTVMKYNDEIPEIFNYRRSYQQHDWPYLNAHNDRNGFHEFPDDDDIDLSITDICDISVPEMWLLFAISSGLLIYFFS